MAMRTTGLSGETVDDYVGPKRAKDANDIRKNILLTPDVQCLAVILGKSEIHGAREKLATAIEAARGKQFLGAGYAKLFAEVRAEDVLAAVATSYGKIGCAVIQAAGHVSNQDRIFIVGMRGNVEHAAHLIEAAEVLENGGGGVRFGAHEGWGQCKQPGEHSYKSAKNSAIQQIENLRCRDAAKQKIHILERLTSGPASPVGRRGTIFNSGDVSAQWMLLLNGERN